MNVAQRSNCRMLFRMTDAAYVVYGESGICGVMRPDHKGRWQVWRPVQEQWVPASEKEAAFFESLPTSGNIEN